MSTLKDRIKQLRKEKQLTQEQFGKIFGIVKSTVSMYESGGSTPDDEIKKKIAEYFNVSIDYLMGLSDVRNPYSSTEDNKSKLSEKEKLVIDKEAEEMIDNLDKMEVVEFCGVIADDEDKEYLKEAYKKFLTDVRVYNKQKYTPKKYRK